MRFSRTIIRWYVNHKRSLPWRDIADPYKIWLSEVILQQTRVEQGMEYYHRFIERFPDIGSLASAPEDEVMKIWQGLGYYSRARNLQHAARTIVDEHDGIFPEKYQEIRRLKGIGDYSAAAIASIAFGEPYPVIDGNVQRVIARYAGIAEPVNSASGKKLIMQVLEEFIDTDRPGTFNQAVMELGALICKPQKPLCKQCPIHENCYALQNDLTQKLPVVGKIKPLKNRYFHYVVIISSDDHGDYLWLQKRTGKDIWQNLYDFPLIESERELTIKELKAHGEWKHIFNEHEFLVVNDNQKAIHILTHRKLHVNFVMVYSYSFSHSEYLKVNSRDIYNYPVPRLIEKFLKKIQNDRVYFPNFRINQ